MVSPLLLGAGGIGGGFLQGLQQQKQQQQRQQLIQALLARKAAQNPGGTAQASTGQQFGPQNWGADNTTSGGSVMDQWGNPIGPAASQAPVNPASVTANNSAVPMPTPSPLPNAQGATPQAPTPSGFGATGASAMPYLNGPYQAQGPADLGSFGAGTTPYDDAMMGALFSGAII